MTVSSELREYAEVPDRFSRIAEGSSVTRFDDGRICVLQGPTWASISAPNVHSETPRNQLAPPTPKAGYSHQISGPLLMKGTSRSNSYGNHFW